MPSLAVAQRFAETIADKLGVEKPTLIWAPNCPGGKRVASDSGHSHHSEHRGTICLGVQSLAAHARNQTGRTWRWFIAHEVTHLKVKNHSSPYFSRWMERLGYATGREKQEVRVAGLIRCRHQWQRSTAGRQESSEEHIPGHGFRVVYLYAAWCRVCGKSEEP